MIIPKIGLQTTHAEDERLNRTLQGKYSMEELSFFVVTVIENSEIPIVEVCSILVSLGYSSVSYDDIDEVMLWSRQLLSQRQSEVDNHGRH